MRTLQLCLGVSSVGVATFEGGRRARWERRGSNERLAARVGVVVDVARSVGLYVSVVHGGVLGKKAVRHITCFTNV